VRAGCFRSGSFGAIFFFSTIVCPASALLRTVLFGAIFLGTIFLRAAFVGATVLRAVRLGPAFLVPLFAFDPILLPLFSADFFFRGGGRAVLPLAFFRLGFCLRLEIMG
jgi:hypothetical protein